MTDLLLDTHVWIWLSLENKTQFSRKATKAIGSAGQKWLSAISCWELAKLVKKKELDSAFQQSTGSGVHFKNTTLE